MNFPLPLQVNGKSLSLKQLLEEPTLSLVSDSTKTSHTPASNNNGRFCRWSLNSCHFPAT